MNEKILAVLLQLVKALKADGWATGPDWELTLKTDGHIPLIRAVKANGSLDDSKWEDDLTVYIDLKLASEDEITFFPEFTLSGEISIGEIPTEDISYKMQGNTAFTEKDVKDHSKATSAAREITRMVENHVSEVYQDYVEKNEEFVRFYKHNGNGQNGQA